MIVVGVDPGGNSADNGTGIVARDGTMLLYFYLVDPSSWWPANVVDIVESTLDMFHGRAILAVEDIHPPNPHMGTINVQGIIDTAKVFGALLGRWPQAIVIEPAGHGSHPRNTYPPQLIGPREGAAMRGRLRHCRSAWDIAGTAPLIARIREASGGATHDDERPDPLR